MKNKNLIIVGVIALLVGGAAGFIGGMQYQKTKSPLRQINFNGNTTFGRGTGRGAQLANGGLVRGQVISSDSNSITVKMTDGSTKIVILGSSTTIGKSTTGSKEDLTNGVEITAFGTTNSDGSVTAQNIQIGNLMMFGGPKGSPSPSASASPSGQGY